MRRVQRARAENRGRIGPKWRRISLTSAWVLRRYRIVCPFSSPLSKNRAVAKTSLLEGPPKSGTTSGLQSHQSGTTSIYQHGQQADQRMRRVGEPKA